MCTSGGEAGADALVVEVKRIRGKKNSLSVAALNRLRDERARTIEPAGRADVVQGRLGARLRVQGGATRRL